jgi:hypothetical protein
MATVVLVAAKHGIIQLFMNCVSVESQTRLMSVSNRRSVFVELEAAGRSFRSDGATFCSIAQCIKNSHGASLS